jgi:hypothetical protein
LIRKLSDTSTSNSGIYIVEGLARGQAIPIDGDSVTAFVGPTPRGPVDHAVRLNTIAEFLQIFGTPECHCRVEFAVRQFFANGGSQAVVVRVSATRVCNLIHLPCEQGELVLAARNPGPLEHVRASIDYDGIEGDAVEQRFNLIVQRLRSAGSAWIDAQEYYRNASVDPGSRDYVGYLLAQSELVQISGVPPAVRPDATIKPTTMREAGYVDAISPSVNSPAPGDYDYVGSATHGTGLNALSSIPDVGQVCLISGAEGRALGPVAMLAADRYCREQQALLIIDPPERWQSVEDVLLDQERSGFSSPNAITWFPGVRTRNKQNRSVTTSIVGAVAAALNASARSSGVYQMYNDGPVMLRGKSRLTARLSGDEVRRLARVGVNSLIQRSPLHLQLLGNITQARYGSIAGEWNDMDLRQRVLFILRRVRNGTRWTFFEDSTPAIWRELEEQLVQFLTELHTRSFLCGENAAASFFVKCDADTNIGFVGNSGEIAFVIGFALRRPGEFLAFRLQRSHGVCRISELGWQSGFAQAS